MKRYISASLALAPIVLIAACSQQPVAQNDANAAVGNADAAVVGAAAREEGGLAGDPVPGAGNRANDPERNIAMSNPDGDPTSAAAAGDVVRRYYAAIDRGDFRDAYALWGDDGKASNQSLSGFEKGFAQTASTEVAIGEMGNPEGAAGSIYIAVPVEVDSRLKDGTRQHFTGSYTLRRVNDVPGSTAEQRRWHIASADLKRAGG